MIIFFLSPKVTALVRSHCKGVNQTVAKRVKFAISCDPTPTSSSHSLLQENLSPGPAFSLAAREGPPRPRTGRAAPSSFPPAPPGLLREVTVYRLARGHLAQTGATDTRGGGAVSHGRRDKGPRRGGFQHRKALPLSCRRRLGSGLGRSFSQQVLGEEPCGLSCCWGRGQPAGRGIP